MITIYGSSRYAFDRNFVKKVCKEYLESRGVALDRSLNVAFVGKRKMTDIAKTYKNENVALPVLAFPYGREEVEDQEGVRLMGEVVICFPQAVLLAAERNKRLNDILKWLLEHAIDNLLK